MKRILFSLVCVNMMLCTYAQISIDNRKALYDNRTNTLLATIPQADFGKEYKAKIDLDDGFSLLKINGTTIDDGEYYTFDKIETGKTYPATIRDSNGNERTLDITFTFLPIIQLTGSFGYDYEQGVISIISTDAKDKTMESLSGKLKWRGGTTNTPDKHKRNYTIKFSEEQQLFGMREDDKWILDAGQADMFRLRNRAAHEIWNDMARKPYYSNEEPKALSAVRGCMVEVFLNDEYVGIYCLTESMDRKQMKLKKFDKDTKEIKGSLWKSEGFGSSLMWTTPPPYDNKSGVWDVFEVKYPDLDDLEETDYSTLWEAINFVANSSEQDFREHVATYFDIPVIIDYYIFLNVLNAFDNVGKNMFWAVYDKTKDKKLTLAVWDLDGTVGQRWIENYIEGACSPEYDMDVNIYLIKRLADLNVDNFNDAVVKRYHELRQTVLSTDNLTAYYTNYYDAMNLSGAMQREENRWSGDSDINGETLDIRSEIQYITHWLEEHLNHLDRKKFNNDTRIRQPFKENNSTCTYNLNGQAVDSHRMKKGIYVRNGGKYVVK